MGGIPAGSGAIARSERAPGRELTADGRPATRLSLDEVPLADRAQPVGNVDETAADETARTGNETDAVAATGIRETSGVAVIVAPSPAYSVAFCIGSRQQKYTAASISSG
jgi:hypothetical protein